MDGLFGEFLDSGQEVFVEMVAAELRDQFIVVNLLPSRVSDHVRIYDYLLLLSFLFISLLGLLLFLIGGSFLLGLGRGLLLFVFSFHLRKTVYIFVYYKEVE